MKFDKLAITKETGYLLLQQWNEAVTMDAAPGAVLFVLLTNDLTSSNYQILPNLTKSYQIQVQEFL